MLKPFPAERMTMWPMSRRVNTPKNDDGELIRPVRLIGEPEAENEDITRANEPGAAREPANWSEAPIEGMGGLGITCSIRPHATSSAHSRL